MSDNKEVTVEKNARTPKKGKPNGRPNVFKRIGGWFKRVFSGMGSELKKVSWPSFGKVVKQTGVVFAVVLFFLVIVTAFDFGLQELLTLVRNAAGQ